MAYTQTQKVTAPSPGANNNFSSTVVVDGYYAAIGEPGIVETQLYRRNIDEVWELTATLVTRGHSLAMWGGYLVVGDSSTKIVGIYLKTTTGSALQTISNGGVDGFGSSVAINGSYIAIGAPDQDSNKGEVYIYEKGSTDTWTAYSGNPIIPSLQTADDYFGCSVALDDDSVIIGAKGDNQNTGAVYIFARDTDGNWEQSQKILASDGAINDEFGYSLSASSSYSVVGARLKESSTAGVNAGAAYVYKYSTTWYETDKLEGTGESSYEGNHFGESVYINGDYIIIGSPVARSQGVADIFYKKRSWGHLKKIVGSDSATGDDFGVTVSISGRFAIIGSPENDTGASGAGVAYLYEDPPVRLRLAQEFDVNAEYLPSKASVYLKRVGQNPTNYWEIYNTRSTVIDATNFSTISPSNNVILFSEGINGFTGNGYMILMDDTYSNFSDINYPIRAIEVDTFDLWIRCISTNTNIFQADILIDGMIAKTLNEVVRNPSILAWDWINTKIVLPDTREHILGIKIKENGVAIDKLYIDASSSTPYAEGPDYSISPYLTVHIQVYESNNLPDNPLYIYDYKNSITEIIQDDWYNFNINALDNNHGYTAMGDFVGSYYLVMSCSGSSNDNFIVWEMVDNDEYMTSPSAIRI